MTEQDKFKLQSAYGCTACGGSQFSASGGSFQATSDVPTTYCDWSLSTKAGKQIVLDFTVIIIGTLMFCKDSFLEFGFCWQL